jgi:uncharacterized membrane protein YkoI
MKTLLAVSALLGAAVCLADDKDKKHRDDARQRSELHQAVDAAKISFYDAIAVAQKEVGDGRITEVELEWKDGAPRFEVEMLVGDSWKEVQIDATNGKVQKVVDDLTPDDSTDTQDPAEARRGLDEAKQTINQAIDIAVREYKDSKLIEVDLERRDKKLYYELKLLEGDKIVHVDVDAVDGKVVRRETK